MSAEAGKLEYYSFGSRVSSDTRRPYLTAQGYVAERVGNEAFIRPREVPLISQPLITEADVPKEFLLDPNFQHSLPSGGYTAEYRFMSSGEIGNFILRIFPEIDKNSVVLLQKALDGDSEDKRKQSVEALYSQTYIGVSHEAGLWLASFGEIPFHMRRDGNIEIAGGYEENVDEDWEGLKKYKFDAKNGNSFECTIAKAICNDYIVDKFEDDIIYHDVPQEYYIVAGVMLLSGNVHDLIAMVNPMLKNTGLTDERLRQIVMPYLYLTPVKDIEKPSEEVSEMVDIEVLLDEDSGLLPEEKQNE